MTAAFVETAEHLIIFQTENLDAYDESLESAYKEVSENHAQPVGMTALGACKLKYDLHDRSVAYCESAYTDE